MTDKPTPEEAKAAYDIFDRYHRKGEIISISESETMQVIIRKALQAFMGEFGNSASSGSCKRILPDTENV